MRSLAEFRCVCQRLRWLRRHIFALRLAACFVWITVATGFSGGVSQGYLIWVANGVLLAYLLLAPRRRWPAYLAAGLAAHIAGSALIHTPWRVTLLVTPVDLGEVILAALLLHKSPRQIPRFTQRAYLLRFLLYGVLTAPVAAAGLFALAASLFLHAAPVPAFLSWAATDSLGVCVVTPACVAVFHARLRGSLCSARNWAHLLPIAAAACAVFAQNGMPLPFILYPLLIMVLLRLGIGWASLSVMMIAAIGGWFTVHGMGPFAASPMLRPFQSSILLQLFIATAMVVLYSLSVVLDNLRSAEARLSEIALRHALVTENSRDIILLADFDGRPRYISSAVRTLTGWGPEETMQRGFADVIHPEDLPRVQELVAMLRQGAEASAIEYRVRRRSGGYLWVEGNMRVFAGPRPGILQIVRDITERKLAEKRLRDAYRAVEIMAVTDALTGLANRRQFDHCLDREWRRCLRERAPLSLLLIDVDHFKAYNDRYGHLSGDTCLRRVAEATQQIVVRASDLVARFGGEEFAVILPNTANPGALDLAVEICDGISAQNLQHQDNPMGVVTVSVGCATLTPQLGESSLALIELADRALYQAKNDGRNRVINGVSAGGSGHSLEDAPRRVACSRAD